jgi:tetratricopeptide (TPR) repeat protein
MRQSRWNKLLLTASCILLLALGNSAPVNAQTEEAFGDDATDPVRLFERGQAAHARGELERALGFYEQALKVRPEFPEAQFQRGSALASLERLDEAETAFRTASSQKKNWSLPHSALGALLMRRNRDAEAEQEFRQALTIDKQDGLALRLLANLRLRAGDPKKHLTSRPAPPRFPKHQDQPGSDSRSRRKQTATRRPQRQLSIAYSKTNHKTSPRCSNEQSC